MLEIKMLPEIVYKVVGFEEWDKAVLSGQFEGSEIDIKDGFIHFSTAQQTKQTVAKHFAGRKDLLLVAIATKPMARHYKMEVSRGGDLFPHLYAKLPVDNAQWCKKLPLGKDDIHIYPKEFPT